MKLAIALLCCAFSVNAWTEVPGYPEKVYATTGQKIESNGSFKNYVELALVPDIKKIGIAFHNYREDKVVIPYGEVVLRGCTQQIRGTIANEELEIDYNQTSSLLMTCKTAIFLRVYNQFNDYATYRIP